MPLYNYQFLTKFISNIRRCSLFFLFFMFLFLVSCKTEIGEQDAVNNGNHEEESDYIWDSSKVTQITLNETSISVSGSGASADGSKVTIKSEGNYSISGTLTNGQVIVNTTDKGVVRLILNGVNIKCTSSAPLYVMDAGKTVINLVENKENYLTDGSSYVTVDDEPNAALFCKSNLTIFGLGKLTVTSNYLDGITSKDGLILKSGTINVSAIDDGIRGKDYLMIKDGTISVASGGDGLKSDNELSTSLGFISITKGEINVTSGADAIDAQTDIKISDGKFNLISGGGSSKTKTVNSTKGIKALSTLTIDKGTFTISAADDALHTNGTLIINGGTFALSSSDDGIHADASLTVNTGNIVISKSYEGMESHILTIKDGNINVVSSNDCLNATAGTRTEQDDKSFLNIFGGTIALNASAGDPLDSNGSMVMTGGKVIVHGPASQPEVAIDYNGTFNVSGGFLIASGPSSNMLQSPSTSSSQKSLQVTLKSALASETIFHIEDANGIEIVSFKPIRKYLTIVVSSPLFVQGSTYKIITGGTSTGTVTDGLINNGVYTPGTTYASFTVSGTITKVN
jgi:hypothetical protein